MQSVGIFHWNQKLSQSNKQDTRPPHRRRLLKYPKKKDARHETAPSPQRARPTTRCMLHQQQEQQQGRRRPWPQGDQTPSPPRFHLHPQQQQPPPPKSNPWADGTTAARGALDLEGRVVHVARPLHSPPPLLLRARTRRTKDWGWVCSALTKAKRSDGTVRRHIPHESITHDTHISASPPFLDGPEPQTIETHSAATSTCPTRCCSRVAGPTAAGPSRRSSTASSSGSARPTRRIQAICNRSSCGRWPPAPSPASKCRLCGGARAP
jgi:hypothetical protein